MVSITDELATLTDLSTDKTIISRFSDGEIKVELLRPVRGQDVFIVQSTCSPVNDNLMELILMADALKRASASSITAVMPYFGYSRQDRRPGYSRVPISARVVADLIQSSGINRILTVDLHALQIEGFFKIPVDNISAINLFAGDISRKYQIDDDVVIVSPDVGGVARARQVAKELNVHNLAIVDKRRPAANQVNIMNIIGNVSGKTCIIIDDIVDTAGTLCKAAQALIDVGGAKQVVAYATHGVLSGNALQTISNSVLNEIVITDSIPCADEQMMTNSKVRYLHLSPILAETIDRISTNRSISVY